MKSFLRISALLVIIVAVVIYSVGTVVPPGHWGVRQYGVGPYEGFQNEALPPGLHWGEPSGRLTQVHIIPSTLQAIHFHHDASSHQQAEGGYWRPSVRVETFDKGEVSLDLTVLARLLPEPQYEDGEKISGGPADLVRRVGLTPDEWVQRIDNDVKHHLRVQLRQLTNADFYDPALREHKRVVAAQEAMNKSLKPVGIEIEAVLLRRYTYEVPEVNRAIADKNLQVQRERLSDVESDLAKVKAELDELKAQLQAEISVIQRTTPQKVKAIRSEGDLEYTKSEAEGLRLVAEAEAEASKMKAEVFAEMSNANVYLAQELAPLLGTLKGGVVSEIDPYNLEEWMQKLGLDEKANRNSYSSGGFNR